MQLREEMLIYRAKHGISQAKLAQMCGLNTMTICNIENGLQTPKPTTICKIRAVIGEEENT